MVREYYNRSSLGGRRVTQSTDTSNSRLLPFCGLEVKNTRSDGFEALARLSLWLSTGLRKMVEIYLKTYSDLPYLDSQLQTQLESTGARSRALSEDPTVVFTTLKPVSYHKQASLSFILYLGGDSCCSRSVTLKPNSTWTYYRLRTEGRV